METTTATHASTDARLDRLIGMWRIDKTNANLYRRCIDLATELRQYGRIVDLAADALASNPADDAALFDKANGLIGIRDYRAALDCLAELQQRTDQELAIRSNIGLCHYCLQEYAQALPHLERSYALGNKAAGMVRMLVTAYHHVGMLDQAKTIAAENTEPAKSDAALAGAYALMYLDGDDAMRAAQWAKAALALNPRSLEGRVTQASLLTLRMQTDQARQMLETVLADHEDNARAWIGLGTLSLLSQDFAVARRQLERGTELMPGHVGSWHVLAWTQLLLQDLDAAARTFEHALALDRNFAESHGGLATIAALRGDRAGADRLIQLALRLDPDCLSAKYAATLLAGKSPDSTLSDALTSLSMKDGSALSRLLAKAAKKTR